MENVYAGGIVNTISVGNTWHVLVRITYNLLFEY